MHQLCTDPGLQGVVGCRCMQRQRHHSFFGVWGCVLCVGFKLLGWKCRVISQSGLLCQGAVFCVMPLWFFFACGQQPAADAPCISWVVFVALRPLTIPGDLGASSNSRDMYHGQTVACLCCIRSIWELTAARAWNVLALRIIAHVLGCWKLLETHCWRVCQF